MPESRPASGAAIPQDTMLARLAQSEQMREFFIQMWLQNPALAERAGGRVRELLSPVRRPASADFSIMSRSERRIAP